MEGRPPSLTRSTVSARPRRAGWLILLAIGLALGGCKGELYTKLSEVEANEMVALLLSKGIEATRAPAKDGSISIMVDQSRFAQAVEVLQGAGLPRQTFTNLGEVFKGGGLIASPTEERARYIFALSQELSKTVSQIDGVVSARIHVVLPKNDLLKQDMLPSSASVFIRHDKNAALRPLLPQIKLLVANSIEGLNYEKVSVVFVPVDRIGPENLGQAAIPDAAVGSPLTAALAGAGGLIVGLLAGGAALHLHQRRRIGTGPARSPRPEPIGPDGLALDAQAGARASSAPL